MFTSVKLADIQYFTPKTGRSLGHLKVLWNVEESKYAATFYSPAGKPIATRITSCASIIIGIIGKIQDLPREDEDFVSLVKHQMAASKE